MIVAAIIPTHKTRGVLLRRAIESVMGQDAKTPVRAIVWHDGLDEISCEAVEDGYRGVFHHFCPLNHGTWYARNGAIERALWPVRPCGPVEAIGFCDSDDYWLPHHLATLCPVLASDERLDAVCGLWRGEWQEIKPDGSIAVISPLPAHMHIEFPNTNCWLIRRRAFETWDAKPVWFPEHYHEDQQFFGRVMKECHWRMEKKVTTVCTYTRRGDNKTYASNPDLAKKWRDG
jgi:hypothetical protein